MPLSTEDTRCIEALVRFDKKRRYDRPVVHLNRHAVVKNMPDEGVLPVRCKIGPGDDLDREPLPGEHQQVESKSREVFTKTKILPGCNHKDINIGVRPVVPPCHGTEEYDLFYCIAARLSCLCREFVDDRSLDRNHMMKLLRTQGHNDY